MEDALGHFHPFKDVLLLGQVGKMVKAKGNALRMEFVKNRKEDDEATADTWVPSKKRCEMSACQDYISHKVVMSKELDVNFNFQKINLMSHWVEQICR
jgi:hypothetical protein